MLRVLGLHPTQRNIMDSFLARHNDSMDAMESVMDMVDDWDDRSWMMRPRRCLARRQMPCPYITPAWRSLSHLRPLLDDTPLLIVRLGDGTRSAKKSEENLKKHNLRKQGVTQSNKKEQEQSVDTKDCSSEMKSAEKVWRYSVDVGGCDEVRAFTEDGLLVVEGRGRDCDSSVMIRHVTTLPPHVKAETLTATQKDGRLELSHRCGKHIPSVVNIPITNDDEQKKSENQGAKEDKEEKQVKSVDNSSEANSNSTTNSVA